MSLIFKILLSVLALLFATGVHSYPKDHIGRVTKISGKIARYNTELKLREYLILGAKLNEQDRIVVNEKSFIKILMNDDTIFQFGPNTKFNFDKFKYKPKKKRDISYNLLYGQIRALFVKQPKKKAIIIKTPNIAMGVRGTELLSDVYRDDGILKTDVALLSGKLSLDVSKLDLPKIIKIELEKGQAFDSLTAERNLTDYKKSISELPGDIIEKLKTGKETFLFNARHSGSFVPRPKEVNQQKDKYQYRQGPSRQKQRPGDQKPSGDQNRPPSGDQNKPPSGDQNKPPSDQNRPPTDQNRPPSGDQNILPPPENSFNPLTGTIYRPPGDSNTQLPPSGGGEQPGNIGNPNDIRPPTNNPVNQPGVPPTSMQNKPPNKPPGSTSDRPPTPPPPPPRPRPSPPPSDNSDQTGIKYINGD